MGHRAVGRGAEMPLIAVLALELPSKLLVVGFGDAEQVGDDQQREGIRVLVDELAFTASQELVDLAIGEPPHELLVLVEPLGCDQPQQQRPLRGVLGGIERRQLVAERQPVAVQLDDLADVVALERNGPLGERSGHGVAVREGDGVVVHRHRFLEPGDHDDTVMGLTPYRSVLPEVLVVRVRVLVERSRAEEVDRVEVGRAHGCRAHSCSNLRTSGQEGPAR